METSYTPVEWVYREIIEEHIEKGTNGKIFFFADGLVEELNDSITSMEDRKGEGVFIVLNKGNSVRIDRLITLFGKPGAAYTEYDSYANACMDCMGGYTSEELNDL